ncbi:MAG: tRNA (adenosine(37)-N6)-dimethylallyltransferase MiaA [Rhizobiales bacterium]|nr:tRNA (adenosine(37)-N6)-dimethylallyltransferase MiaA [Hyphomicrobiales bacterium]
MRQTLSKSALLIAGPTASGKSALALKLARVRNGVIINADSMQVYRELRLLSARPTAEEEAYAPHRLYGHVSGADDYSVAHWLADAIHAIETTWRAGKLPIICGGTGLYFMALERGLSEVPPISAEVREHWRSFTGDLHAELAARDRIMAMRLAPSDRQRIIRALEVFDTTGLSLAHWQAEGERNAFLNQINVERHYVEVPREVLYGRAEQRFDAMMSAGALEEVAALPPFDAARPIMKAIGVPELQAHLRGEKTLTQAVSDAKTATRHYIKRQTTWWRGQMKHWTTQANSSEASA